MIALPTNDQGHFISTSLGLDTFLCVSNFIWYLFNNFFCFLQKLNVLLDKLEGDSAESSITKNLMLTRLESFLHECPPELLLTGSLVNAIMVGPMVKSSSLTLALDTPVSLFFLGLLGSVY